MVFMSGYRKTSLSSFVLIALVLTGNTSATERKDCTRAFSAPETIRELSTRLQGKTSHDVRATIIEQFGPADRETGSGLRIEEWDTADGVLQFHPMTGPSFFNKETGEAVFLLRTSNPVASNILGSYEMTTQPDPANHGTRFWLGNLELSADGTYTYVESGQFPELRAAQSDNFFFRHPYGKFQIIYATSITPGTLLESVAVTAPIARLAFISSEGEKAIFSITTSKDRRRLVFGDSESLSFVMDKSWEHFWN